MEKSWLWQISGKRKIIDLGMWIISNLEKMCIEIYSQIKEYEKIRIVQVKISLKILNLIHKQFILVDF